MKKIFAITLALVMALCAMSISVFALEADFEDGSVGEWTTHAGAGNLSVVDGALLSSGRWNGAFKTAHALGDLAAGTYKVTMDIYAPVSDNDIDGAITYSVYILDGSANLDGAVYASENFVVTSGEWTSISWVVTLDTDATGAFVAVDTLQHDPWARSPEFSIDNVVVGTGDASEVPVEETPVEEPAEEAPVETPAEEAPAEDAPVEEPAETGLALAVVPMVVAAVAVVASKRR